MDERTTGLLLSSRTKFFYFCNSKTTGRYNKARRANESACLDSYERNTTRRSKVFTTHNSVQDFRLLEHKIRALQEHHSMRQSFSYTSNKDFVTSDLLVHEVSVGTTRSGKSTVFTRIYHLSPAISETCKMRLTIELLVRTERRDFVHHVRPGSECY